MVVNEQAGWLYFEPPKTGSTTLRNYLTRPPFNGRLLTNAMNGPHEVEIPERNGGWRCCYSTRHPFTRSLSLWKFFNVEGSAAEITFGQWLRNVEEGRLSKLFAASVSQWVSHLPMTATVLRLETLTEDLYRFFRCVLPPIPHYNTSRHERLPHLDYLPRIEALYADDLARWYAW